MTGSFRAGDGNGGFWVAWLGDGKHVVFSRSLVAPSSTIQNTFSLCKFSGQLSFVCRLEHVKEHKRQKYLVRSYKDSNLTCEPTRDQSVRFLLFGNVAMVATIIKSRIAATT